MITTYRTSPGHSYDTAISGEDSRISLDHLNSTNYWLITQGQGSTGVSKFRKIDISTNPITQVTEKAAFLIQLGILIRDSPNSNLFLTFERGVIGETNYQIRTYDSSQNPPTIQQVLDTGSITKKTFGIYLESMDAVTWSRKTAVNSVNFYQYKPTIHLKSTIILSENTSFSGNSFKSMSEVVQSK